MTRLYDETEHQELLYRQIDCLQPLDLHIPSALGPLSYYVCLRVRHEDVGIFEKAVVSAQLSGLRNTDATVMAGEGCEGVRRVPAGDGFVWLVLCRISMARGDGQLHFSSLLGEPGAVDLLLCTWLRFVESGQAEDLLGCQDDPQWAASGVPLGGIGTGRVDICRDGRLRNFSGNNNQDMPFEAPDGLPGAYLALAANGERRVLATRSMAGIEPCGELHFEPAFPQATLRSPQIVPGIDAEVLFSGPLAPHDVRTSCLPAALIRWRVRNTGASPATVDCTLAWPNLVGEGGGIKEEEKKIGYGDGSYRYWTAPEHPFTRPVALGGSGAGLVHGNTPNPICNAADGRHFLLLATAEGLETTVDAAAGTATARATLAPGEERTIDMLVLWEMPNWIDTRQVNQGLFWQNHFADGEAMAGHILAHFDAILDAAGRLRRLLAKTTLPRDIAKRLSNCCYPLVTNSVFFRDGRFSINEGPTEMSGCYGTIDQRLGAHPATQLLFPELNATELGLFAAVQDEDGAINHDLGHGHLDKGTAPIQWPDLCCSFVIQHARHAWTTGDDAFAKRAWPKVKQAVEKHGHWADEGKGVAQLGKLGTSYDSYHYIGTTAYMGTLWIATLKIARHWAKRENDDAFVARIDDWLQAAATRIETDLWNGDFYRAYASPGNPSNENSHAGMLAGEYYCRLLTGEDVLPRERLLACADALMALNCSEQLAVPADEAAPGGGAGSLYGWLPYIEAFALTPCALLGHAGTLPVWQRMIRAMQGENDAHPCDTRLMYRPQSGEPSWGAYYMTAPASWLVYDAVLDFCYLPECGALRFNPTLDGVFALVHPRFWGLGTAKGDARSVEIVAVFGGDTVAINGIELTEGQSLGAVSAGAVGEAETRGVYRRQAISSPALAVGDRLGWTLEVN